MITRLVPLFLFRLQLVNPRLFSGNRAVLLVSGSLAHGAHASVVDRRADAVDRLAGRGDYGPESKSS